MNNQPTSFAVSRIADFVGRNVLVFRLRIRDHRGMSQQPQTLARSRHVAYGVVAAVVLLLGANSVNAQWAAKPAPSLPRSVLDQAWSGSVVLGLVFESNGQVRNVSIVRTSGIPALDDIARDGANKWRLDPAALRPSDLTQGRRHLVKFFQSANVARRVEPFSAIWKEL